MISPKIAFFDTRSYDKKSFSAANTDGGFDYEIDFRDYKLNENTALTAQGFDVVCVFVNDVVNAAVIETLKNCGVKLIALRCAGFNNVDLQAAAQAGIKVVRVPAYSPYAVAEHGAALLMSLTRHIPQAYLRTKTANFNIEGLTGRDLHGLTAGILGTGKIGQIMAGILKGFGMKIIAFDPFPNEKWAAETGAQYVSKEEIFQHMADDLWLITREREVLHGPTRALVDSGAMQRLFASQNVEFNPDILDYQAISKKEAPNGE